MTCGLNSEQEERKGLCPQVHLAGVSVRRVEDISEAFGSSRVPPAESDSTTNAEFFLTDFPQANHLRGAEIVRQDFPCFFKHNHFRNTIPFPPARRRSGRPAGAIPERHTYLLRARER